jgi:hypothetical protein
LEFKLPETIELTTLPKNWLGNALRTRGQGDRETTDSLSPYLLVLIYEFIA